MVCRSDDDDEKDASWTEWAKDKISGAFHNDHVKATAQDSTNQAKDLASGSADYVSEKAVEAEDAAADAAKQLSEKDSD
ncbi:hypothetical protein L1987_71460 [Smallanthus sonchifolius]|uniref:Uncharacterized protein n=1 Tax=Smallanthus sonchifolius TaxID=185202 RepID=A0ACB9AT48_9ASTR|nr:hypothetical protein L1987_71460 [Smallanthus sonchifolius]